MIHSCALKTKPVPTTRIGEELPYTLGPVPPWQSSSRGWILWHRSLKLDRRLGVLVVSFQRKLVFLEMHRMRIALRR